jgi:3-deoxy-7-phosphoheptulonate synthase
LCTCRAVTWVFGSNEVIMLIQPHATSPAEVAEPRTPPKTRDTRIQRIRPLISPALLLDHLPLSLPAATLVATSREDIVRILNGQDDRLLVVVGPCSIHDPAAAMDYARRLKDLTTELASELYVVMRVYYEKPRTTVGWKGLINDPHLDGSFAVNDGLHLARKLLLDILELGLPGGCEFLDPITPQFFSDAVSWSAIGARTTESQVHRQLASGLSMPVGFKNGTNGSIQIALDAMRAAAKPHSFFGVTDHGLAGIVTTVGNPDTHLILRGGNDGPNYSAADVASALAALRGAGLAGRLMIDASHGNSGKDHRQQVHVARNLAAQLAGGERGITGVMLESFLVEGRQDQVAGAQLAYGQSITDACLGWDATADVLGDLAQAVRARR